MSDAKTARANWRTSAPIYAAMLAPVLALAFYANTVISDARGDAAQGRVLAEVIDQATDASALAHELQKERGMSAGFVGSKGAQFRPQLAKQRQETDAVLQRVRDAVLAIRPDFEGAKAERAAQRAQKLERFFGALAQRRAAIDALKTTVPALAKEYTGAIRGLLSVTDDPMLAGLHDNMARLNVIYGDVLMAKEFAGVERAMGSVGYGSGSFAGPVYIRYSNLQSRQAYLLDRAKALMTPAQQAGLQAALASPAADRVRALRALAAESLETGDLKGVTGPEWFAASTNWLKELTKLANGLAEEIRAEAHATAENAQTIVWTNMLIGGVLIAACLFFGLRYVHSMIGAMRGLRDAIRRIDRREDDVQVPGAGRSDELGEIARALSSIASHGAFMARVQAGVDSAQTAILVTDSEDGYVYGNGAFQQIRERRAAAFAQVEQTRADGVSRFTALFEAVEKARSKGTLVSKACGVEAVEITLGDAVFEARIGPVHDAQGQTIGRVIELQDVTVVRKLEREVMEVIADVDRGAFQKRVTRIDNLGFTSFVATGLNQLMDNVSAFMARLNDTLGAMGDGDLSRRMNGDFQGEFEDARRHVNEALGRLSGALSEIVEVAGTVERSAQPISKGASDLAGRAESQAATLQETAATMEEMTASIQTNAEKAQQSFQIAEQTSTNATKSNRIVTSAVTAMERIEHSSSKISEIITVIESIAFQTNLLALNAAVEAARAGDAGRGFAVVASEVRALAQRSSDAAKDITQLIQESTAEIGGGVRLVKEAGVSLEEIVEGVRGLTETVEGISSANAEQSAGVTEICTSLNDMDGMTQQNAALSQESAAAAGVLSEQASRLRQLVSAFALAKAEASDRRAA